ncbi:hypothetical protein [Nocardia cyriacigeorgica]|uniref:hypothetical protein n=1 Tax=Nocardia cyriacigeorgica TaxID=135487 RepID=UPI002011A421|nr:hypothetical protein [Nocardia cyriacigeorgica]
MPGVDGACCRGDTDQSLARSGHRLDDRAMAGGDPFVEGRTLPITKRWPGICGRCDRSGPCGRDSGAGLRNRAEGRALAQRPARGCVAVVFVEQIIAVAVQDAVHVAAGHGLTVDRCRELGCGEPRLCREQFDDSTQQSILHSGTS